MPHRRLACALALVVAALGATPAASAAAKPSYLFALTSSGGSLTRDASGWWITLTGTSPIVTRFSDRPQRLASTESPARFAAQWQRYGFAADPPNAALVIADGSATADIFVVELRRPRVNGTRVTFRARPIRTASTALARYVPRADRMRDMAFGPASLFIDDGTATVFQPLTLQVANAQAGQSIVVSVTPYGSTGIPVGFSSGPALATASGLQVIAQSGTLPLATLSLTTSQIRIETVSNGGGGAITFSVPLYLAADEDIEMFLLQSYSDPDIQITAQVGDALPQVVNMTPTVFAWD